MKVNFENKDELTLLANLTPGCLFLFTNGLYAGKLALMYRTKSGRAILVLESDQQEPVQVFPIFKNTFVKLLPDGFKVTLEQNVEL